VNVNQKFNSCVIIGVGQEALGAHLQRVRWHTQTASSTVNVKQKFNGRCSDRTVFEVYEKKEEEAELYMCVHAANAQCKVEVEVVVAPGGSASGASGATAEVAANLQVLQ
jgi:hypothetical protein